VSNANHHKNGRDERPYLSRLSCCLRIIDGISEFVGKAASYLLILLVIVVVQEVVRRYFFNMPSPVAMELSRFLHSAIFLLAGAYTLSKNSHIALDVVQKKFTPRTRAFVDMLTSILFFLFLSVLFWTSAEAARTSWSIKETTGSAWNPPYYPLKAVVPISIFLLLLQGIANFIRNFIFWIKGVRI
jgi:TRAP-type mannitol/chloroaromatic compound transport system permease small subunit